MFTFTTLDDNKGVVLCSCTEKVAALQRQHKAAEGTSFSLRTKPGREVRGQTYRPRSPRLRRAIVSSRRALTPSIPFLSIYSEYILYGQVLGRECLKGLNFVSLDPEEGSAAGPEGPRFTVPRLHLGYISAISRHGHFHCRAH